MEPVNILTADDIWKCKLSIRRLVRRKMYHLSFQQKWRCRRSRKGVAVRRLKGQLKPEVPEIPVSLAGEFTLGQIKYILFTLYANPFKKRHVISFPSGDGATTDYIVDVETGAPSQEDSSDQD